MSTHTRRGPGRTRSSRTDPLRIQIDKRPTNWTDAYSCVWYVSPVERDVRGDDTLDFASYGLEIRLNGMMPEGGEIRRFAWKDGDEYTVHGDDEYEALVQEAITHGEAENEYRHMLAKQNVWPESAMRSFGFRLDYFERMERAWRAALELFDFGYTGP